MGSPGKNRTSAPWLVVRGDLQWVFFFSFELKAYRFYIALNLNASRFNSIKSSKTTVKMNLTHTQIHAPTHPHTHTHTDSLTHWSETGHVVSDRPPVCHVRIRQALVDTRPWAFPFLSLDLRFCQVKTDKDSTDKLMFTSNMPNTVHYFRVGHRGGGGGGGGGSGYSGVHPLPSGNGQLTCQ